MLIVFGVVKLRIRCLMSVWILRKLCVCCELGWLLLCLMIGVQVFICWQMVCSFLQVIIVGEQIQMWQFLRLVFFLFVMYLNWLMLMRNFLFWLMFSVLWCICLRLFLCVVNCLNVMSLNLIVQLFQKFVMLGEMLVGFLVILRLNGMQFVGGNVCCNVCLMWVVMVLILLGKLCCIEKLRLMDFWEVSLWMSVMVLLFLSMSLFIRLLLENIVIMVRCFMCLRVVSLLFFWFFLFFVIIFLK